MINLKIIPNPNYATHPAYGMLFGKPRIRKRAAALKRFLPHFFRISREAFKLYRYRPIFLGRFVTENEKLQNLILNGVVATSFSTDEIAKLNRLVNTSIGLIEERKTKKTPEKRYFGDKTLGFRKEDHRELYSQVENMLKNHGIIELASRYRRRPLAVQDIKLMVNDPSDADWKDHFKDIGLPDPHTAYMHVDTTVCQMKCLIYLSEVNMPNGPFSYVLGSHLLNGGFMDYVTRKVNDIACLEKCYPATRELFWALPRILQKKAEFGNDLSNDSPEAKELLAREHKFTSNNGNAILFDSDGIHRGGMIQEGRRCILQVLIY